MSYMSTLETLEKYEPRSSHHEVPVRWDWAKRWEVGSKGKTYIDFTSGIFVANIGHSHPDVLHAIRNELGKPLLHSYAFPNESRAKLVEKLVEMTGFEKVFLCSTGAEAVEVALRCMWAKQGKVVIGQVNANHGRTFGASQRIRRVLSYGFRPKDFSFPKAWLPTEDVSGIIFESYFGWNAQFHPEEWVQEWCGWAKENNIPVCFDEVQAGFGRTGKMFGYEHYDVKPDLIVVGKALGGGMPISAVLGSADLLDAPDDLSSTHTGNPVCCAAALASLEVLEREGLVKQARRMGHVFVDAFERMGISASGYADIVKTDLYGTLVVNGNGMIWGIDLGDVDLANQVVDKCAEKGLLLVKTHRGTIKIGPPLTIPTTIILDGLDILKEAIKEVSNGK